MCVMQVGTLMPERSHKYFELKLWASENAAISAHVSLNMSRKVFGGWGFAPDPDWGLILPRPLLFKRRDKGFVSLRHLRHMPHDSIATVVNSLQNRVNSISLSVGGARGMAGGSCPLCPNPCPSSCPHSKS